MLPNFKHAGEGSIEIYEATWIVRHGHPDVLRQGLKHRKLT